MTTHDIAAIAWLISAATTAILVTLELLKVLRDRKEL